MGGAGTAAAATTAAAAVATAATGVGIGGDEGEPEGDGKKCEESFHWIVGWMAYSAAESADGVGFLRTARNTTFSSFSPLIMRSLTVQIMVSAFSKERY